METVYRLSEDHLHYGLEGKIVEGSAIHYFDMALYDKTKINDYMLELTVKGTPDKHDGTYLFDSARDVESLISKITGTNIPYKKLLIDPLTIKENVKVNTHKGSFVFCLIEKIF